jgi:hypothetical protein
MELFVMYECNIKSVQALAQVNVIRISRVFTCAQIVTEIN